MCGEGGVGDDGVGVYVKGHTQAHIQGGWDQQAWCWGLREYGGGKLIF